MQKTNRDIIFRAMRVTQGLNNNTTETVKD